MTAARIGLGIWVALTRHTLYIANDNDFLASFNGVDNPNKFFVFAFDDTDLPGFQPLRPLPATSIHFWSMRSVHRLHRILKNILSDCCSKSLAIISG
jgi:hypothetical protein